MEFKAAMFDFDGTVTAKGAVSPTPEMAAALVSLAQKMPIAFCTGRQLERFELRGLQPLLEVIDPGKRRDFLENLYLIAENGSIGYDFDPDRQEFVEFYRAEWPSEFMLKEEFVAGAAEAVKGVGKPYDAETPHKVIQVFVREKDEGEGIEGLYEKSKWISERIGEYLGKISLDYGDFLHIGDAGIAVVVCPAKSDKDSGIRRFGEFLRENRGLDLNDGCREIVVIGDQAQLGGNDFYFLNGRYGRPFTVGADGDEAEVVLDEKGEKLLHDLGTLALIERILAD